MTQCWEDLHFSPWIRPYTDLWAWVTFSDGRIFHGRPRKTIYISNWCLDVWYTQCYFSWLYIVGNVVDTVFMLGNTFFTRDGSINWSKFDRWSTESKLNCKTKILPVCTTAQNSQSSSVHQWALIKHMSFPRRTCLTRFSLCLELSNGLMQDQESKLTLVSNEVFVSSFFYVSISFFVYSSIFVFIGLFSVLVIQPLP